MAERNINKTNNKNGQEHDELQLEGIGEFCLEPVFIISRYLTSVVIERFDTRSIGFLKYCVYG